MLIYSLVAVAGLPKACRHRCQGEVVRLAAVYLIPAERCRDSCVRLWPDRVSRSHGSILGVLVVVHENSVAFLLPPFAGRNSRCPPLHLPCQGEGGSTHLVEGPSALDSDVDVNSSGARGLGPANQPELLQRHLCDMRDLAHLCPRHTRHRVEVDPQLIGMLEIVRAYGMWMQFQARQVCQPHERRGVARHYLIRTPAGRKAKRDHLDPLGPRCGCPLLVEELFGYPV